ncbi:MAG: PAS-domain containing protein, partial [Pseudolabrys sp.]
CTLLGLIENRITTGSLNIDPKKYRDEFLSAVRQGQSMNRIVETPDGRAILVVNRSIKDGEYWIGTHDDITERIHAERKSSAFVGAGTAPRRDRNRNSGFPRRRRRRTANGDAKHRGTEVDCGGVVEFVRPHV